MISATVTFLLLWKNYSDRKYFRQERFYSGLESQKDTVQGVMASERKNMSKEMMDHILMAHRKMGERIRGRVRIKILKAHT